VEQWRKKQARGDVIIVRYADDAVLGFEHRAEAERFLDELRERLGKFGLELHPEKTRLIEFGRYAAERRKQRGDGKPETLNFLGFTPICGTNYQTGNFTVRRKTMGKRLAAKLKEIGAQLQRRMHAGLPQTCEWLRQVVRGYFQYHAVPGNWRQLRAFRAEVLHYWCRSLRRRSQRRRESWIAGGGRVGEEGNSTPLPSSNRTCRFPASGSRRDSRREHAQVVPQSVIRRSGPVVSCGRKPSCLWGADKVAGCGVADVSTGANARSG